MCPVSATTPSQGGEAAPGPDPDRWRTAANTDLQGFSKAEFQRKLLGSAVGAEHEGHLVA